MDFAKMMSAQIAKKQSPSTAKAAPGPSQAYLKRAELEAQREAAYRAEQEAKERERLDRIDKKRKLEEEEDERHREREVKRQRLAEESRRRRAEEEQQAERERRKRIGLPDLPTADQQTLGKEDTPLPEDEEDLPEEELIAQLRGNGEPVRLFGETHVKRLRRYRRLQEPSEAMVKPKAKTVIPTTLEPVEEADMKVSAEAPAVSDAEGRVFLARQLTAWFNLVLKEWAVALASRSEEVKTTFTGQAASNSMVSAVNDLKPLFRRLEKINKEPDKLPPDLLNPIADIVHKAQERQYVKANDGYLQLSIGKAAWPIGVTMVGIHERSAREKLHETDKGKAHIMADEATRKILQSIKRCLTFAQTRWPPEDVGQMMG